MPVLRCPRCDKSFDSEQTTSMPFCSERCRQGDLGSWLDEAIGVPLSEEELADLQATQQHQSRRVPPPSDS